MSDDRIQIPGSTLTRSASKTREFQQRARESSSLGKPKTDPGTTPPGQGREKRAGRRARPMKRSQPKRDWSAARAKVEHAACRLCAPDESCGPVEAAHVIGRECDRPKVCGQCNGTGYDPYEMEATSHPYIVRQAPCSHCEGRGAQRTLYVHPDSVIPLGAGHHKLYDAHSVDVLPVLTLEEQIRAVENAGGIELARQRTCPSQYRKAA